MVEDRAQLQTEATVGGQQCITGHLRAHLTVTQDEVGQDGERRFARRTLETPDGEPTQTDPDVMRVACQAPASTTGRLVFQLKAEGQDEGKDTFEKRLPIAKQLKIGRFVLKIDSEGPVFTGLAGCVSHGHPQVRWSMQWVTKDEDNASQFQEDHG